MSAVDKSGFLARREDSTMLLGVSEEDGRGIWLNREQALRHLLVAGATGSGKTEFLIGLCINAIAAGSGAIFVDGKGDVSTFARIRAAAAAFGREDDVVLLNFSTPQTPDSVVVSNTIDPIAGMTPEATVQTIAGFLHKATGDHAFWQDRFIGMLSLVVPAVLWVRENVDRTIGLGRFGEFLTLDAVTELADPLAHPGMPEAIRESVREYLRSLPGYSSTARGHSSTVKDQHGYLSMQATRTLSSIGRDYRHVLSSRPGDVDMLDAVRSRRILVVVLPALQKSEQEVRNLGRMVVGLLKNAMARTLEMPIEGPWDEVVDPDRKTTAPHLVVMDEATQYLDAGMGVMAAQARSLGYCLAFGVQSMNNLQDRTSASDPAAGNAVVANTATKILMRSDQGRDYTNQSLLDDDGSHRERDRPIKHLRSLDAAVVAEMRMMNQMEDLRRRQTNLHPHQRRRVDVGPFDVERYLELHGRSQDLEKQIQELYAVPEENLWPLLPKLPTGGFVVVHGHVRLQGRGFWAGPDLRTDEVRLPKSFVVDVPDEAIDLHYDRGARISKLVSELARIATPDGIAEIAGRFSDLEPSADARTRIHRSFSLMVPAPQKPRSRRIAL